MKTLMKEFKRNYEFAKMLMVVLPPLGIHAGHSFNGWMLWTSEGDVLIDSEKDTKKFAERLGEVLKERRTQS